MTELDQIQNWYFWSNFAAQGIVKLLTLETTEVLPGNSRRPMRSRNHWISSTSLLTHTFMRSMFFHIEPQSVQSVTFQIQLSSLQCPSSTQDRTFLSFQHWLQNGLLIEPNCNPCYKPKKISGFRWNLYLSGFEKGRTIITLTVKVPHNELLSFHYPVEHFEPLLFYTFLPIAMLNPK